MKLTDKQIEALAQTHLFTSYDGEIFGAVKFAQALLAECSPVALPWISTKDRLPEDSRQVLASNGKATGIAQFHHGQWIHIVGVKHWMEIPVAPEHKA